MCLEYNNATENNVTGSCYIRKEFRAEPIRAKGTATSGLGRNPHRPRANPAKVRRE